MKQKKLNKAIDLGISELVDKGLNINLTIPNSTLFGTALTIVLTTTIILLINRAVKSI